MAQTYDKKELAKKSEDISKWYNDVVLKAELADYGPVKGTMVIRPYGYAIWESVQKYFDALIKAVGVENAYFPMFIPSSFLTKEKEHVKGFSPELAVVTKAGGEDLAEPLVVRPTSETIMYAMYAKWINSWRDLPLLLNQWCNVVRWEKRTYLFLRTTEFLWQEGHTAHATHEEAIDFAKQAHDWYRKVFEDLFAIPVMLGTKSSTEKFAGAQTTYTVEALMPDGKALQSATSHDLGQNFSKVFDIKYQNQKGQEEYVWQTSWGLSTRSLGGLFLVHGDDSGLRIPPNVAPIQVVIVPIVKTDGDASAIQSYTEELCSKLQVAGIRTKIDSRTTVSPGRKFNDWEVKGVPVRIEVGAKETEDKTVTVVVRGTAQKNIMPGTQFVSDAPAILSAMQQRMFEEQKQFLASHTFDVSDFSRFEEIMKTTRGFIRAFWCEDEACEKEIKEKTKATTRCMPLDTKEETGVCVHCGKSAKRRWIFAQSY